MQIPGDAEPPVEEVLDQDPSSARRTPRAVLSGLLDVPLHWWCVRFFFVGPAGAHRREIGTGTGTVPTCGSRQVLNPAMVTGPGRTSAGWARASGSPRATEYGYKDEAYEVLAAEAPTLREAGKMQGRFPYLIWTARSSPLTGARTRRPPEGEGKRQVVLRQGA